VNGVPSEEAAELRVDVKTPAECSDEEIEAFRALVASGGEVMRAAWERE
jgi:hypothetical protein